MDSEDTLDLMGYLSRLKRHLVPALVLGLLAAVGAFFLLRPTAVEQTHQAKAHVMVAPADVKDTAEADLQAQMLSRYMYSLVALKDSPKLTDDVLKRLSGKHEYTAEQLHQMTQLNWGGGSMLLAVFATAADEQEAIDVSQAMADSIAANSTELLGLPADQAPMSKVVEPAHVNTDYVVPATASSTGVAVEALAAGIALAVLAMIALEWVASSRARRRAVTSQAH